MGKATPVSFIRESVGQICVVGEWLWSLRTEQESGRAHSCCHPGGIRERHWQGERSLSESNLRENWESNYWGLRRCERWWRGESLWVGLFVFLAWLSKLMTVSGERQDERKRKDAARKLSPLKLSLWKLTFVLSLYHFMTSRYTEESSSLLHFSSTFCHTGWSWEDGVEARGSGVLRTSILHFHCSLNPFTSKVFTRASTEVFIKAVKIFFLE